MQKIRKDADDGQAEDEYERPGWDAVMFEIQEVRETQRNLEKFLQTMQSQHQQDHTVMLQTLEEERSRWDVVEQELAELTEFYKKETENLREEIAGTNEMIDYQSNERTEEFFVALESCQNNLHRLELQQQEHLDPGTPEDSAAQLCLDKLIKGMLYVLSYLLVFVCTMSRTTMFFKSFSRILWGVLLAVLFFLIVRYWSVFPV